MISTRPSSSTTGAPRQRIERRSPRAFVNVFSYSAGRMVGRRRVEARAASPARSAGSMKTSQKNCPRTLSRSSQPIARERRRVERRDPSVGVDGDEQARRGLDDRASGTRSGARSSAWSRSLSSASATVAATLSTSSGSFRERLVVEERADPPAVALDDRRGARAVLLDHDRPAVAVDERRRPRARTRARATGRRAPRRSRPAAACPARSATDEVRDRATRQPAPENPDQEGERERART